MKLIIFILVLLLYILYKNGYIEKFYGMNYIQHHEYLKCCNSYGCSHPKCQNFLVHNMSSLNIIGFVYEKGTSTGNILKLYSRKNNNTNRYDYFIKHYNTNDDYLMKQLNITYLYNGDEIYYNNKLYVVSLYENNGLPIYDRVRNHYYDYNYVYNNLYNYLMPNNRFHTNNLYSGQRGRRHSINYIPIDYIKHGYLLNKDNNDYMLVYKRFNGRNRWRYFVKKQDILLPLNKYENKDISKNDIIKLPFSNKAYLFNNLDN